MNRVIWALIGISLPTYIIVAHWVTNEWGILGLLIFCNACGYLQGIFAGDL
jgi:hypothetical protein